jgi:hypothetical protein
MALEHMTDEQIRVCIIALKGRREDVTDELVDELQRRQAAWPSQDQPREAEGAHVSPPSPQPSAATGTSASP